MTFALVGALALLLERELAIANRPNEPDRDTLGLRRKTAV
jgi:hypothetical protein